MLQLFMVGRFVEGQPQRPFSPVHTGGRPQERGTRSYIPLAQIRRVSLPAEHTGTLPSNDILSPRVQPPSLILKAQAVFMPQMGFLDWLSGGQDAAHQGSQSSGEGSEQGGSVNYKNYWVRYRMRDGRVSSGAAFDEEAFAQDFGQEAAEA